MYRGTTPTISLSVKGLSDLDVRSLYLTIKQGDKTIEKTVKDIVLSGDELKATLTQSETLSLDAGFDVKLQLRVLTENNTAYATKILKVPVFEILKDGEIT